MPWLLNVVYFALLVLVSPVLMYRRWVHGKYRDGWSEKFWGRLPERTSSQPCLWLHAVSVGEVLQLRSVMHELIAARSDWEFVITTTTRTGLEVAKKEFPQHTVCYCPLDFSWAVRRAILRIRPSAIVLVELELWPNLILAADRLGVPLALINGRVSAKSFRGYRRVRPLLRSLLQRFVLLAAQNDEYAERLLDLGAPRDRLHVTGSIKFDGVQFDRHNAKTRELRQLFGIQPNERVFIAGSTQAPEEAIALDIWQTLRLEFPDLRLVLVPRHKERFEEVAQLVLARKLPLRRRSGIAMTMADFPANDLNQSPPSLSRWKRAFALRGTSSTASFSVVQKPMNHRGKLSGGAHQRACSVAEEPSNEVLLLDTLGELGACWGLADVAFVGGSLTQRGGQNMLEPSAFGAAVLFGPNTWNFRDIVEQLLSRQAAQVVRNGDELTAAIRTLLNDPNAAQELGQRAKSFLATQQGATGRTVRLLLNLPIDVGHSELERRAA